MYGLMVFSKDAFELALHQPDQVIKIDMMMKAVQHLKNLCVAYEQGMNATDLNFCEQQVIHVSKECFPEIFCVSFKVLQDVYSETLSG